MVEGYVLHSLAWRETSLIAEVFTREDGRLGLVARGARRPRSPLRGLLQPFQPLSLRYSAKGDLRTLMAAEWQGGSGALSGEALMAGFYVNELVLRLLPREDAHPTLFDRYAQVIVLLAQRQPPVAAILRGFECCLLREMGVAPEFSKVHGNPVVSTQTYWVTYGEGITAARHDTVPDPTGTLVSGETLLALSRYDSGMTDDAPFMNNPLVSTEAKVLLRGLIAHQLGDLNLQSRQAIIDLARLRQKAVGGALADTDTRQ